MASVEDNEISYMENVLLNTHLFEKTSKELTTYGLSLRTSGVEAFAYVAYQLPMRAYYLFNDKCVLRPSKDWLNLSRGNLFSAGHVVYALDRGEYHPSIAFDLLSKEDVTRLIHEPKYLKFCKTSGLSFAKQIKLIEDTIGAGKILGLTPSSIVLVEKSLGEEFYEYLSAVTLRTRGYLVGKWCPTGIPVGGDIWAYKPSDLNEGAFFTELFLGKTVTPTKSLEGDSAVVEAEPNFGRLVYNDKHGISQLKSKYLYEGYFKKGFVAGPSDNDLPKVCREKGVGAILVDKNGTIHFQDCELDYSHSERAMLTLKELNLFLERS